jgi:hypothetical protein
MFPAPPLAERIAFALQTNDVESMKGLLREAYGQLQQTERLLLDVLAQNPGYRADGGLHARLATFLRQRAQ